MNGERVEVIGWEPGKGHVRLPDPGGLTIAQQVVLLRVLKRAGLA